MTEQKPPLPPFTRETALQKVQAAEDASIPVREPRHRRSVVAQLRQRTVGVRRRRPDATPRGQHQRRVPIDESDRRIFGPGQTPSATRTSRSS